MSASQPRKTRTPEEIERAAHAHLKKADPVLYKAAKRHPGIVQKRITPRYRRDALFSTLAGSIVGQQLSIRAADTIWGRVRAACGGSVTAERIEKASEEALRGAGLSASKVKALKALSAAVLEGDLDLGKLKRLPHSEAVESLTRVWGVGPWTAEMFLIFALGAEDVFSPGDLGLIRSIEKLYGLPKGAPRDQILALTERWSPYRSFACLVLWEIYDSPA